MIAADEAAEAGRTSAGATPAPAASITPPAEDGAGTETVAAVAAATAEAPATPVPVHERFVEGDMSYENLSRLDYNRDRTGEGLPLERLLRLRTVVLEAAAAEGAAAAADFPECSICLEKFKNGGRALRLSCSHLFHGKCVGKWFATHRDCPNCRRAVWNG